MAPYDYVIHCNSVPGGKHKTDFTNIVLPSGINVLRHHFRECFRLKKTPNTTSTVPTR
jgi:hypothetical protein